MLVVAIEYAGADLPELVGGSRRPVLEHAYDTRGGFMLAHPGTTLRIAFPDPQRGWPSAPQLARCARCIVAVAALVRDVVTDLLAVVDERAAAFFGELDIAGSTWLFPPSVP